MRICSPCCSGFSRHHDSLNVGTFPVSSEFGPAATATPASTGYNWDLQDFDAFAARRPSTFPSSQHPQPIDANARSVTISPQEHFGNGSYERSQPGIYAPISTAGYPRPPSTVGALPPQVIDPALEDLFKNQQHYTYEVECAESSPVPDLLPPTANDGYNSLLTAPTAPVHQDLTQGTSGDDQQWSVGYDGAADQPDDNARHAIREMTSVPDGTPNMADQSDLPGQINAPSDTHPPPDALGQDTQPDRVEEGTTNGENVQAEIACDQTGTAKKAFVPRKVLIFDSLAQAESACNDIPWSPPDDDTTVPTTDAERKRWTLRVFQAINNREDCLDNANPTFRKRWVDVEGNPVNYYPEKRMEKVAWKIVVISYPHKSSGGYESLTLNL